MHKAPLPYGRGSDNRSMRRMAARPTGGWSGRGWSGPAAARAGWRGRSGATGHAQRNRNVIRRAVRPVRPQAPPQDLLGRPGREPPGGGVLGLIGPLFQGSAGLGRVQPRQAGDGGEGLPVVFLRSMSARCGKASGRLRRPRAKAATTFTWSSLPSRRGSRASPAFEPSPAVGFRPAGASPQVPRAMAAQNRTFSKRSPSQAARPSTARGSPRSPRASAASTRTLPLGSFRAASSRGRPAHR